MRAGENEGDRYDGTSKKWLTPEAVAFYCERATGQRQFWLLHLEIRKPEDFNRLGHIFQLKYRDGGVLERVGHTEASVDLAVLTRFEPVAVLCEVVDDDGSVARLPKLREFAQQENLKIVSAADLISLSSEQGDIGDGQDVLVKVHSECLTGDIWIYQMRLQQPACTCGAVASRGVLMYFRGHEGRGRGKFRAYFARARNGATVVLGRARVHFSSATAASDTVATKVESRCHIDGCGSEARIHDTSSDA
ncbi:hypothetical protein NL676_039409 [Syzygium grande]|nr:hypothetical protein NL676_039409 [Syzygium grande]